MNEFRNTISALYITYMISQRETNRLVFRNPLEQELALPKGPKNVFIFPPNDGGKASFPNVAF